MNRKLGAEFVGTFLLVFLAVGAAVFGIGGGVGADAAGPASGTVGVAFAFGLVVLMLAYAFGPVSGTHVNPAVTLAMVLAKRMPGPRGRRLRRRPVRRRDRRWPRCSSCS